ncbi:hypothetical protein QYM36_004846 [Artemia franciscana]|uniref:Glycogen [starch] synthase n=1 Tax=Artemia franciscana TaxID=6661 RepID=A0AA88IDU0_ARTSF|nr:hypothetical protein QYM36_004842 [Artemia franciscana]KAK2719147.1 hypothetical protein QYM36_004844 [Artemia franciscana]KAK2719149.1 hypothetical protein QYM36_004846 [Artemia franciscana]
MITINESFTDDGKKNKARPANEAPASQEPCLSCCVVGESKTDTYDESKLNKVDSTNDLMEYLDRGESAVVCNKWTFESSWEVANKVGGIYTVIRSKAIISVEELGNQYILLGPYKEKYARVEVEDLEFPAGPMNNAVSKLRDLGFRIHTGRWLVAGNPLVILFDIGSASCNLDQYKQTLFEKSGIGIPHEDIESNDAVIFGFLAAQFIDEFHYFSNKGGETAPKIVCHFH